jgi:hypothetical protein
MGTKQEKIEGLYGEKKGESGRIGNNEKGGEIKPGQIFIYCWLNKHPVLLRVAMLLLAWLVGP